MASYPASAFSWVDRVDNVDDVLAADINSLAGEIDAIEADLVGASGTAGGLAQGAASFYARWTNEHSTAGAHNVAPPVGSIIAFYDFNGALTFNTTYYAYCNGQTKTVGGSSRTLPDLSGRYMVGFGNDGDGLIGSATWATAAVGNASHQIDIYHLHTMGNHTHSISGVYAHTHTYSVSASGGNHGHSGYTSSDGISGSSSFTGGSYVMTCSTYGTTCGYHTHSVYITGDGAHSHSGNTDSTGSTTATGTPSTNNSAYSLSATQSIQPRSIRVRFLMRIL